VLVGFYSYGRNKILLNSKRAIFFDFGDTLASTTPSYLIRIATAMRTAGYPVLDKEFQTAYVTTDYEIYRRYKVQGAITPDEYREWFFPILCRYLFLEGDPYAIRSNMREALREIQFERVALPGAVELLKFLKEKGFTLGIISNNDGRTEEKCDEIGIRRYFDIIADSTKLGLTKPDSRIFHLVLDELKLSPSEAIHTGDLYGSDVMGGLNAGLDVIWLNKRQIGFTELPNCYTQFERFNGNCFTKVQNLTDIQNYLD
jgi:HAD superfamily hydrolase (TIGR01549 family)